MPYKKKGTLVESNRKNLVKAREAIARRELLNYLKNQDNGQVDGGDYEEEDDHNKANESDEVSSESSLSSDSESSEEIVVKKKDKVSKLKNKLKKLKEVVKQGGNKEPQAPAPAPAPAPTQAPQKLPPNTTKTREQLLSEHFLAQFLK